MRSRSDSRAAYKVFLDRVKSSGYVWFLLDVEQDYPCCCDSSSDEVRVVPFWSDSSYAKRTQTHFNFETSADSIPLEIFLKTTLSHLREEKMLIGPNWDGNLAGLEIDPTELSLKLS